MKNQSAIETPSIPNSCRKARSWRKCNRSLKVEGSSTEYLNIENAPKFKDHWGRNAINFLENSFEVPLDETESAPCTKHRIFEEQWIAANCFLVYYSSSVSGTKVVALSGFHSSRQNILAFVADWQMAPDVADRKATNSNAGTSALNFSNSIPASLQKCKIHNSWLSPGIVVWAKKENKEWWPAEVVDASSLLKCTGSYSIGRNLVKFFGDHKLAWLDPIREISEFHAFYEERSQIPLKQFQDALHEALQKNSHSASDISPTKCSASSDTESSMSRGIAEDESSERQGKRKRKMKIHFDELIFSEKPVKRVRRIRIMRHLGLIAPVGSPFSHSRVRSDAV